MAIKIQNTTVIDDSRNLTNIASAVFSAPVNISSNNSTPSLNIEQQGLGNCLVVQDENNDSTPFVVDGSRNVIIGNTTAPSERTPLLTIDKPSPELTLTFNGAAVNGLAGYGIKSNLSELHITKYTAGDFSTSQRVMTIKSDGDSAIGAGRIGILDPDPEFSLDIIGTMGVFNRTTAEDPFSGISFEPEGLEAGRQLIISRNLNADIRQLLWIGRELRIFTGSPTANNSLLSVTISSDQSASFNRSGGGVVSSNSFVGLGMDFVLQTSIEVSGLAAVEYTLSENYTNFVVELSNVVASTEQIYLMQLLDSDNNIIGTNLYGYSNFHINSLATLQVLRTTGVPNSNWSLSVSAVSPSTVNGGLSGIYQLYGPRSNSSWKRMTGQCVHYGLSGGDPIQVSSKIAGSVNTSSVADKIRVFTSTGTFTSGLIHFYGIR